MRYLLSIILSASLFLLLAACSPRDGVEESTPPDESGPAATTSDRPSEAPPTAPEPGRDNDIGQLADEFMQDFLPGYVVDLPDELFIPTDGDTQSERFHDFTITEPMEFTIEVVTEAGEFTLGIVDADTGESAYDTQIFENDTDTVSLQPGSYRVILSLSGHSGSYALYGTVQA